ncbi:L-type lectin-domain containing receptor kinase SIT2-like [Miscanthus floridulus]|uniref:L-type lectin-domain containing receptor kinase SIT2-like n=1 Tax=Miscanthus floridulus TaxID=154761 RepID=UPI0034589BCE
MAAAAVTAVRVLVPVLLLALARGVGSAPATPVEFTFTGFARENVTTSGAAVTSAGLLQLTNATNWVFGHGFYPAPLRFKDAATGAPLSFSTTFVAAILPRYPDAHGHGLAFALAPSAAGPARAVAGKYLGLFNTSDNVGNGTTSQVVAVEIDTALDAEFDDINDNHVGVDVHGLKSVASKSAGSVDVALASGKLLQVWIEYDGATTRLEVTVSAAAVGVPRPRGPLVSCEVNLSSAVADQTYVGFSAANGAASSSHYVLGWSFRLGGGRAPDLDLSKLPRLPPPSGHKKATELPLILSLILLAIVVLLAASAAVTGLVVWRRRRFAEELEDWEVEYGPHRISYKDLHAATRGFRDVIGGGGFGVVYRGVLPLRPGGVEVAVKKVSHGSRQGLREFVSEIASMSRLRHRNLVQLLGYCRRRGELILVYDYMVNGSLDRRLFDAAGKPVLSWEQRSKIARDVAAGLLYLHEQWEQVVVHRDIKSANVLLDADMNGKLSDFGLARLYDHGSNPQTTHVIGTLGYLAPEMSKTGKATTSTDVFAFGVFLLEVACGRRPMERSDDLDSPGLVDLVLECWKAGRIVEARDPKIGTCDEADVELVLKLGLLCSHPDPRCRPSMRQAVQILEGAAPVPETPPKDLASNNRLFYGYSESFDEFATMFPATSEVTSVTTQPSSSHSTGEEQQVSSGSG